MKTALLLTALFFSVTSVAQTKPAEQPRSSDKVDLKKLEDKYWSQKDEDYSVIQNRLYSKSGKLSFTGSLGTLVNDPFAQDKPYAVGIGYYFNEDFGIEATYLGSSAKGSDSVTEFKSVAAGTSPNYNLPGNAYTLSAVYTPLYAKLAFMNWAIMYFDMGFTLGLGMTEYQQMTQLAGAAAGTDVKTKKTSPHLEIGVMQQLFLSKNFAFRVDFKNSFMNQEIVPYDTGAGSVAGKTKLQNNTYLMFGITLFTN